MTTFATSTLIACSVVIGMILGAVIACTALLSHILRWRDVRDSARYELRCARDRIAKLETQLSGVAQFVDQGRR